MKYLKVYMMGASYIKLNIYVFFLIYFTFAITIVSCKKYFGFSLTNSNS